VALKRPQNVASGNARRPGICTAPSPTLKGLHALLHALCATLSGSALALGHGPWALPTATLCIPFGDSLCRIRNESRRSRMRTALQSFEQERSQLPIFFRKSRFLVALGMAGWGLRPDW